MGSTKLVCPYQYTIDNWSPKIQYGIFLPEYI